MLPKQHIIYGAITTIILYLIFPLTHIQASIIFLSSFLIDVDHYLNYVLRFNDWSLNNARKYFYKYKDKWLKLSVQERKNYKRPSFIFHGFESWIVIFYLSYYNPLAIFILYGFAIHMTLDYIEYIQLKEPLLHKFSQVYVYLSNKNKDQFFE